MRHLGQGEIDALGFAAYNLRRQAQAKVGCCSC